MINLDDALKFGRVERIAFGNAFRHFIYAGEYDPLEPEKYDELLLDQLMNRNGLLPSELGLVVDSAQAPES